MLRYFVFQSSLGDHMRGLQVANERIVNVDFLNTMSAAFITLVYHDFFNKFMEHSRCQLLKGSVFLRNFYKAVDIYHFRILLLNLKFQGIYFCSQSVLFVFLISREDHITLIRQFAGEIIFIQFFDDFIQLSNPMFFSRDFFLHEFEICIVLR